jgi:hypothetical protein
MAGLGKSAPSGGVEQKPLEAIGEVRGVEWVHQNTIEAVADELGRSSTSGGHDGSPGTPGFEDDDPEGFEPTGNDEHRRTVHRAGHLLARQSTYEVDALGYSDRCSPPAKVLEVVPLPTDNQIGSATVLVNGCVRRQ